LHLSHIYAFTFIGHKINRLQHILDDMEICYGIFAAILAFVIMNKNIEVVIVILSIIKLKKKKVIFYLLNS